MIMDVVDFLTKAVVDDNPEVVFQAKLPGDNFDGFIEQAQKFRGGFEEVADLFFGDNQKVHRGARAMIGDYNDLPGFVEDFSREFPVDNAGEYRCHTGL